METLNIAAHEPAGVFRCAAPAIYVDGLRRRDLRAASWELLEAPQFGRAKLCLHDQATAGRVERIASLPPIGAAVELAGEGWRFAGTVTAHLAEVSDKGELLSAEVVHRLSVDLSGRLSSLVQIRPQGYVTLASAPVRFNDGHLGLCSPSAAAVGGRSARLFDAGPEAKPWTVADALGYLLATAVPADVATPGLAELEALAGDIDLGELEVTGLTAAEALLRVAQRGGLSVRAARTARGIVIYRPGHSGRRGSVRLQPAGSKLTAASSNLWQGRVTVCRRPARRGALALGAAKRYESTFPLRCGWDRDLETYRWRDFVRSMSGDWPRLADVYRKWVLNEHGWYSLSPWHLPVHNFAGISAADFALQAPRPLLPCLSTRPGGQSLGVVVEVACDGGPWRQWRGPLWVSRDECAIYLGGDCLPGEFFQAAAAGSAQVRVTATVQADARLTAEVPGDAGAPTDVLDFGSRARWQAVHHSSVFFGREGLGQPANRDDTELLTRLAARHGEVRSTATAAELVLGWVDTGFDVGDVIERVEGRELELASSSLHRPSVVSVHHDFAEQTTKLIVRG